jgi:hypothetical protein
VTIAGPGSNSRSSDRPMRSPWRAITASLPSCAGSVGMRTALAIAAVVLVLPSSAVAAPVVTLRPFPGPELRQGPFITSTGVGWAQARCIADCVDPDLGKSDYRYLIRSSGSTGRARTLFRTRERNDASGSSRVLNAWLSPQGLAVLRRPSDDRHTLRAGRPGGTLERLFDCTFAAVDDVPVALDGRTLVYEPDPCSTPVQLTVRDLQSGQSRVVPLAEPDNPGSLQASGQFAAWVRYQQGGPHVIVFDLATSTEVYAVPLDPPRALPGWALGADGTVAAATGGTAGPCGLAWYSVAEPVRHELPTRACVGRLRIERGRIFFVGPRGGARFLRSVSLAGEFRDHVRFGRVSPGGFDVRGARIAWAASDCGGGEAIFGGRLGRGLLGVGPVACPTRLAPGPQAVRRGRAKVSLECPRGCSGDLALVRAGGLLTESTFGLPPSGGTVTLDLPPAARRQVERQGSLRVRAALTARDRGFRPVRTVRNLLLLRRR